MLKFGFQTEIKTYLYLCITILGTKTNMGMWVFSESGRCSFIGLFKWFVFYHTH